MSAAIAFLLALTPHPPAAGLTVPPGFTITEYSGSDLANDITCMTIDPKSRVVVAGRGYIRVLVDEKGEGRATKAVDVTRDVKDLAMGLMWEGDSLYAVVDGGLMRWRIGPEGTTAAGPPERIRALKTFGEHHAHAIRRGPDGWLYLLAGDSAGIDERFATLPTSPIKKPIAGCVVRFSPDFKQSEIVADGFRNPYGLDFDLQGNIWTFDADNERCVSLPWYEPTRVYRVVAGGHHGWRNPQVSETWRCPPYFVDVVPPIVTCGRGSPTGVVYHKHTAWPIRQRGLFLADWTFGKVWRFQPGFMDKPEPFIVSEGDHGFAPTALAVHPETGDLFISIGGRGTRGAVYRVRWTGREPPDSPRELRPNADWSVEWSDEYLTSLPQRAKSAPSAEDRIRALAEISRHQGRFSAATLVAVIKSTWELSDPIIIPKVADLIAILPADARSGLKAEAHSPQSRVALSLGLTGKEPAAALALAIGVIGWDKAENQCRLHAARAIQLALGDLTSPAVKATVWAGYTPARALPPDRHPGVRKVLRRAFPSGEANLDRELSRTLAMLEDDNPAAIQEVIDRLTADSDPLDDVHYLIVLSRLRGPRKPEWTAAAAGALLKLDAKIARLRRNRDRNWPLRVAELHAELAKKDPALNSAILNHADFGRPDHALFTRCPGFDRKSAAEIFVKRAERDAAFEWNAELVELVGELPVEVHRPILRKLAAHGGLDDAIVPILARAPQPEDKKLFIAGVTSPRLEVVRDCLAALDRIQLANDGPTALALVRCLRLLPDGKEGDRLRASVGGLLEKTSGAKLGSDRELWAKWLAKDYPVLAAKLGGADGVDVEAWRQRLAGIDWKTGSAERGRGVFAKASCAACHSGSQAMGPDLSGVAGRFSRDDLFTAILQPSKDIAPRYRTTQIETTDGRTYQGLIVYEAVDGLILQTGPAQTVRIAGERIESKRFTESSLMPAGLLDKLADGEIADLYAFLKSLGHGVR